MITQYEGVAEVEALKWQLRRPAKRRKEERTAAPASPAHAWEHASEQEIRAEMERRVQARTTRKGSASHPVAGA